MKDIAEVVALILLISFFVALGFLFYGSPDLFDTLRELAIAKAGGAA